MLDFFNINILPRCVLNRETGCWEWRGWNDGKKGYGKVTFRGIAQYVHRLAFEAHHGPIRPGNEVDHKCVNAKCCNPDHLQQVTPRKNKQLRSKRNGRKAKGTGASRD